MQFLVSKNYLHKLLNCLKRVEKQQHVPHKSLIELRITELTGVDFTVSEGRRCSQQNVVNISENDKITTVYKL